MIEVNKAIVIENSILHIMTAVVIISLFFMGAGGWSFWGLVMLLFTSSYKTIKREENEKEEK